MATEATPESAPFSPPNPPAARGGLPRLSGDYPPWLGVAVTGAYLVLSFAWMIVVGILSAVGLLVLVGGDLNELMIVAESGMPAGLMGIGTAIQFAGMLAIAAGLAWVTRRPLIDAFATRGSRVAALIAALLGGFTVGVFPGKVAESIMEHVPSLNLGNLEMINQTLAEGPLLGRLTLIVGVCILAPLVEELVFRGFMWDALSKTFSTPVVWIATSVVFASYHVDPVHVLAVFFTGLFLGWLRWQSGSVWPSVLAHAVNNSLATSMAVIYGDALQDAKISWAGATLALLITCGFAAVAVLGRKPDPATAPAAA